MTEAQLNEFLAKFGLGPNYTPPEKKLFQCENCLSPSAYWKEVGTDCDAGQNQMVIYCPDCGFENSSPKKQARKSMNKLTRTLHPAIRVLDSKKGIAEYVASDETLDSYNEVIKADGWRFNHFAKNAPLVDSHDYSSIDKLLGKVLDFKVENGKLVETAQWAIDVPEQKLAQIGWKMTEAGYLKAVSVGFFPTKYVTKWDSDKSAYEKELAALSVPGVTAVPKPVAIYQQQEQIELSVCIIGANPNALARAYKAGALDDDALETLSLEHSKSQHARSAYPPADADRALQRDRDLFLSRFHKLVGKL